jgi:nucleoside-diphosphate-sugar epimerase
VSGRSLLVFGYGFTGRALRRRLGADWRIFGASRSLQTRPEPDGAGLQTVSAADGEALRATLALSEAVLIAAPPGGGGCPGLAALSPIWPPQKGPRWIGYLSTTGVYGDRGGGWVREDTPPAPASPEAERRVAAEQGWASWAARAGARFAVFRLPGIYGSGRSQLDRARTGEARRWTRPGQVFSRIHVDDLADALARALDRPERDGVYTLCDDEPASHAAVVAHAFRLLGREPPPEEPLDLDALSPIARRFWAESKRVPNARAKAALNWRPAYPTYREGLAAVLGSPPGRRAD